MTSAAPDPWPAGSVPRHATDHLLAVVMLGAGLFCIGVGLVDLYTDTWRVPATVSVWWHAVPVALMCLLLPVRRRWPLRALGVALVVFLVEAAFGGSLGTILVLFEFLYCGALYGPRRPVRLISATIMAAVPLTALASWAASGSPSLGILMGLQVFAVFGASFWWGASTRTHVDQLALERHQAERTAEQALLREREAVAGERQRMAMDLHDALSGNLAAVTLHAQAGLANPTLERQALETIRATSRNALHELQDLLDLLRAEGPDSTAPPTLAELPALLDRTRNQGVTVELTGQIRPGRVSTAVSQAAYRIVQEALANAARHSPGSPVQIRVDDTTELRLRVSSPGTGGAPSAGGRGLAQMRERADALAGCLSAGPQGSEWVVEAALPLQAETAAVTR